MTIGFIASGGQDLDNVFASGNAGIDAGFLNWGVGNIGNRYAPLSQGQQASGTGFVRVGTDLNAYFGKYGATWPNWPVGSGFIIGANGVEVFVTDTITALFGKMTWQIQNLNGSYGDAALTNNAADRFNGCPGIARGNANSWSDLSGFTRSTVWSIPPTARFQFDAYTDNVGGTYSIVSPQVNGQTEWAPGWNTMFSGGLPLCSNNPPYYSDPQNVFNFSPGAGLYYGHYTPYIYYANPGYWAIRWSAAFCVNKNSGLLNVIRIRVTRYS